MINPSTYDALTRQIEQEKQVEAQLIAQECQWFQDGKNAQVEAGIASKHIAEMVKQVWQKEEEYNPNLEPMQNAPLKEKMDYLIQMKSMGVQAQSTIEG